MYIRNLTGKLFIQSSKKMVILGHVAHGKALDYNLRNAVAKIKRFRKRPLAWSLFFALEVTVISFLGP